MGFCPSEALALRWQLCVTQATVTFSSPFLVEKKGKRYVHLERETGDQRTGLSRTKLVRSNRVQSGHMSASSGRQWLQVQTTYPNAMPGPQRTVPILAPGMGQPVSSAPQLRNATHRKGLLGPLLSLGFAQGQWARAFEGPESAKVIWVSGVHRAGPWQQSWLETALCNLSAV